MLQVFQLDTEHSPNLLNHQNDLNQGKYMRQHSALLSGEHSVETSKVHSLLRK
jgi:hypothetical protein